MKDSRAHLTSMEQIYCIDIFNHADIMNILLPISTVCVLSAFYFHSRVE